MAIRAEVDSRVADRMQLEAERLRNVVATEIQRALGGEDGFGTNRLLIMGKLDTLAVGVEKLDGHVQANREEIVSLRTKLAVRASMWGVVGSIAAAALGAFGMWLGKG